MDRLKALGVGHTIEKKPVEAKDSVCIDQIKISGLHKYTRSYVLGKLNFKPGQKISYDRFIEGIRKIKQDDVSLLDIIGNALIHLKGL